MPSQLQLFLDLLASPEMCVWPFASQTSVLPCTVRKTKMIFRMCAKGISKSLHLHCVTQIQKRVHYAFKSALWDKGCTCKTHLEKDSCCVQIHIGCTCVVCVSNLFQCSWGTLQLIRIVATFSSRRGAQLLWNIQAVLTASCRSAGNACSQSAKNAAVYTMKNTQLHLQVICASISIGKLVAKLLVKPLAVVSPPIWFVFGLTESPRQSPLRLKLVSLFLSNVTSSSRRHGCIYAGWLPSSASDWGYSGCMCINEGILGAGGMWHITFKIGQMLLLGVFENRHWVYLVKYWPIERNLIQF